MIEDKLSKEERLRLESLAQAVAAHAMSQALEPGINRANLVLATARKFYDYIVTGQNK